MTTPRSSVWKKRVFIGLTNVLDVSKTNKQTNIFDKNTTIPKREA